MIVTIFSGLFIFAAVPANRVRVKVNMAVNILRRVSAVACVYSIHIHFFSYYFFLSPSLSLSIPDYWTISWYLLIIIVFYPSPSTHPFVFVGTPPSISSSCWRQPIAHGCASTYLKVSLRPASRYLIFLVFFFPIWFYSAFPFSIFFFRHFLLLLFFSLLLIPNANPFKFDLAFPYMKRENSRFFIYSSNRMDLHFVRLVLSLWFQRQKSR